MPLYFSWTIPWYQLLPIAATGAHSHKPSSVRDDGWMEKKIRAESRITAGSRTITHLMGPYGDIPNASQPTRRLVGLKTTVGPVDGSPSSYRLTNHAGKEEAGEALLSAILSLTLSAITITLPPS
ncbi:hypothetical protein MTO96_026870 [Rhipicephalus appendiculatus]